MSAEPTTEPTTQDEAIQHCGCPLKDHCEGCDKCENCDHCDHCGDCWCSECEECGEPTCECYGECYEEEGEEDENSPTT